MQKLLIVTPALASANNGNWRTAARWAQLLAAHFQVEILDEWQGESADILLALHARRSHRSIRAFANALPDHPRLVALTGTDLYGDLPQGQHEAKASLPLADALIVLQGDALSYVPQACQERTVVVYQSCPEPTAPAQRDRTTNVNFVAVGHLRHEKDPQTLWRAWQRLPLDLPVTCIHIGQALTPEYGAEATALMAADPRFRWVGDQPYEAVQAALANADVLIHPSVMEGGAQAVIEAIVSGCGVLASHMSGNIGLLGPDYAGYFAVGDDPALAGLIIETAREPLKLAQQRAQLGERRGLFTPKNEQAALMEAIALANVNALAR
jgi:putative glycosyltransferase (TIGR04348 family)